MLNHRYIIVSPVRNEQEYAALTLDSVICQSVLPIRWIIVDDGSIDKTAAIVSKYIEKAPWIKMIHLPDRGFYFPGTGVVQVFDQGLNAIEESDWDYVVKLDMDLSFDSKYFENLLDRFESDPMLGIASGLTVTRVGAKWLPDRVRSDHPIGATKVYRRECLKACGGLLPVPGWDLADTLAAQMRGWRTLVFSDLKVNHYRVSGVRRGGAWGRSILQGRFEYRQGYIFVFTFAKAIRNIFRPPAIIGGFGRIFGYLVALIKRDEYLFPKEMRVFLREKQKRTLFPFWGVGR